MIQRLVSQCSLSNGGRSYCQSDPAWTVPHDVILSPIALWLQMSWESMGGTSREYICLVCYRWRCTVWEQVELVDDHAPATSDSILASYPR
jgi:hypothetical protein